MQRNPDDCVHTFSSLDINVNINLSPRSKAGKVYTVQYVKYNQMFVKQKGVE